MHEKNGFVHAKTEFFTKGRIAEHLNKTLYAICFVDSENGDSVIFGNS